MPITDIDIAVNDGLTLHGRLANAERKGAMTPAIFIPGLSRNERDFEDIFQRLAATGRPLLALSLRGRGRSDFDPNHRNYHPAVYRDDVLAALDQLDWLKAVFIGTSLGGIVTMLTAQAAPDRIAGAVINDIGPDLAPEGLSRIIDLMSTPERLSTQLPFEGAVAASKATNVIAFPDVDDAFWAAFARRTWTPVDDATPEGLWRLDFDPQISAALADAPPTPDLWPCFRALAEKPLLVIRGALSDLLTADIVEKMRAEVPTMRYYEIDRVGHAPMLDEPVAAAAIDALLADVDAG